ncbi:uncharacterized protein EDB91DRAFT_1129608 [Suillus paluster]|uniref:uncharacterized protein n=1 Tax=Suillus paluster TaxID=48578 RepID=UPI001B86F4FD|nr:uncharacterized protein EDB91DRAFT_1129608 [Suillus paluster]KAG1741836.1 hypothetical protein EDB91DRAFT_1129608 [Suillus paluster]
MVIRSVYESLFNKFSWSERNLIVHGSAGIGKTYFLSYVLVRRLLARQPVTYQIDESDAPVLCFTPDGFFALPQENSEYHPLFQRKDVLHLIDSASQDTDTHPSTEHTRVLMRGTCGKAIFTTFWTDSLGLDIRWVPEYDFADRQCMKPCTFDEIFAMSALTSGQDAVESLRWSYTHFGSNAHSCLQASHHSSDADRYLHELERAHENFWSMQPTLREREARNSRNLFAIEPGTPYTDPLPYPVSQVASKLLADAVVSMDSSAVKEIADNLLKSEDTNGAGKIFYRHAVVALMSRSGGVFKLGRPDLQGLCHPANEDFVLRTKIHVAPKDQRAMTRSSTYTTQRELATLAENCPQVLLSPKHGLMHPGIDAVMFDDSTSTMWLVQVAHESHRPVSPYGLLFLLDVVRGSSYEPSPNHPWQFVFATRGQPTNIFFQLSGKKRTQYFSTLFWKPRVKPYIMQLRDTDRDVQSSSDPYEQWGFPYKAPQKSSHTGLPQRLAKSLAHLVPTSKHTTKSNLATQDKMASEIEGAIIQNSGVPGAQLLGDIAREQPLGPVDHYMRSED